MVRVSTSSVRIEAPRETVWAVVTDPALVKQWQYGSVLSTDWSVASPIRFTSQWEGTTLEQWGAAISVDAPAHLRYSLFSPRPDVEDKPENYFTMTYTLVADAGATKLTITQEDPRQEAGEDGNNGADGDNGEDGDNDGEAENPVLSAPKRLAESLSSTAPEG